MANPYNTPNYTEQGGARTVIGGEIDVVAGGALKIAGVALTAGAAALNALPPAGVVGVAAGYKLARGVGAVTGTLDVDTGLAAVVSAVACLKGDPATTGILVSVADGAAGHIILKVWKATANDNATPIASVTAVNVQWIAIGTA